MSALMDALPPGSYLALTHPTADFSPAEVAAADLDLVDPGVVPILGWHPDGAPPEDPHAAYYYGAMGRKP